MSKLNAVIVLSAKLGVALLHSTRELQNLLLCTLSFRLFKVILLKFPTVHIHFLCLCSHSAQNHLPFLCLDKSSLPFRGPPAQHGAQFKVVSKTPALCC